MSPPRVECWACGHYTRDVGALDDTTFARLINIQSYGDAELKALAQELADEERQVSRRRRILHGEMDIVRAEMVRRLRDKHGTGRRIFQDNDIGALTAILTGKTSTDAACDATEREEEAPLPRADDQAIVPPALEKAAPQARAIHERFRDLSVNLREERLLRHVTKQLREGRNVDDILNDHYVVSHTNETNRLQLLLNPHVLRVIEDEIRKQFADYDSITRAKPDSSLRD